MNAFSRFFDLVRFRLLAGFFLLILAIGLPAQVSTLGGLEPDQQRGAMIYFQGRSPDGETVNASLGPGTSFPATSLPYVNCHDIDGKGRPEGGVTPPDICWESLTAPSGHIDQGERTHPAFTEELVIRAVRDGIDPAGNRLAGVMPRYSMPEKDWQALVAFLKILGKLREPGLSAEDIRIGTILPADEARASLASALEGMLSAIFEELNQQGVYGRKLRLEVFRLSGNVQQQLDQLQQQMSARPVFAFLSPFLAGTDRRWLEFFEEHGIPVVAPITLLDPASPLSSRYVFFLYPGLETQLRILLRFASQELQIPSSRVAVLHDDSATLAQIAGHLKASPPDTASAGNDGQGLSVIPLREMRSRPAELIDQLKSRQISPLALLIEPQKLQELVSTLQEFDYVPELLVPGLLASPAVFQFPEAFEKHIHLCYPSSARDHQEQGIREFRTLALKHQLPQEHVALQVAAFVATRLMLEALGRAGSDLYREKLVDALETFYKFETGLSPPVSFSPNRRLGVRGAYVLTVSLKAKALLGQDRWIELPDGSKHREAVR